MRRRRHSSQNRDYDDQVYVYKNEHQSENGSKIFAPSSAVTRDHHNQSSYHMPSTFTSAPPIHQQHQLQDFNGSPFSDAYSTQNVHNTSTIAAGSSSSTTTTGHYYYNSDGEKTQVPPTPIDRNALSSSPASFEKPNAVPRLVFQAVKPDGD